MVSVVAHAALGLAVLALFDAGVRLVSPAAPAGLERFVAAATVAVTAAALSALTLGLVGLGANPVALCAAALLVWGGMRLWSPQPETTLLAEAAGAWTAAPRPWRLVFGGAGGAWVAWTAWLLRYPAMDIDSVGYHLPQAAGWVANGSPGSVLPVYEKVLPVGNYPLTSEVVVSWGMGIGDSFAWATVWAPILLGLLAVACWGALRRLRAPRWTAALGVVAVALTPIATHYQQNGANTDLPALTWLVVTGYLGLCAPRRPGLLAPALLAAALAVGTKTSALPLAGLAILAAGFAVRHHLRRLALPLALAAAAGLAVGGYWYLRNFVDHGSPLWPFVATPWGDPEPPNFNPRGGTGASLLDRPRETLDRVGADWWGLFAGGFIATAGCLVAAVVARTRAALALGAVTLLSFLSFATAPTTGAPSGYFELAGSTVRYLGPTIAVAVATLAAAVASGRRAAQVVAGVLLAVAAVLGVGQTFDLGFPKVPSPSTVLLGALAGVLLALAANRLWPSPAPPGRRAAIALAAGAFLTGGCTGRAGVGLGGPPRRGIPDLRGRHDPLAGRSAVLPRRRHSDRGDPGRAGPHGGRPSPAPLQLDRAARLLRTGARAGPPELRGGLPVPGQPGLPQRALPRLRPADPPGRGLHDLRTGRRHTAMTSKQESSPASPSSKSPTSISAARGSRC